MKNTNVGARRAGSGHRSNAGRGAGVRAAHALSQRVVIKARLVRMNATAGKGALMAHLHYIARHGVGIDGTESIPFDETGPIARQDLHAFAERGLECRHQFRFIVSPENAAQMDLPQFTTSLMHAMEADLRTRLDYIAVVHLDTDNPHVHIVVNGVDERGADLVISRDYLSAGMRTRASQLATRELGLRTERELQQALERDVTAERLTAIDRQLIEVARRSPDLVVDLRRVPEREQATAVRTRNLRLARLNELERFGLAEEVAPAIWQLDDQLQDKLQALGQRGDIIKTIHRHAIGLEAGVPMVVLGKGHKIARPVTGEVIGTGRIDELQENRFVVVTATDGKLYYSALPAQAPGAEQPIREGDIITLASTKRDPVRATDRNVMAMARGNAGVYDADQHRARLVQQGTTRLPAGMSLDAFVDVHVKRLDALAKSALVEKHDVYRYKVPPDLATRLMVQQDKSRDAGMVMTVKRHSTLSLRAQVDARGPTWFDEALVAGMHTRLASNHAKSGFQKRLARHLEARIKMLTELGLAKTQPGPVRFARGLIDHLGVVEKGDAAVRLAPRHGQYVYLAENKTFSGTLAGIEALPSGPHAVVSSHGRFMLAPAGPGAGLGLGSTDDAVPGMGQEVEVSMVTAKSPPGMTMGTTVSLQQARLRFLTLDEIERRDGLDLSLER